MKKGPSRASSQAGDEPSWGAFEEESDGAYEEKAGEVESEEACNIISEEPQDEPESSKGPSEEVFGRQPSRETSEWAHALEFEEASNETSSKRRRLFLDNDTQEEILDVRLDDLPYIIAKGDAAIRRLAQVSGADVEINGEEGRLKVFGTAQQRNQLKKFVRFIGDMRQGAVRIHDSDLQGNGIVVRVPSEGIKNVIGRGGRFMRTIEETWKVIMFQAAYSGAAIIGGSAGDTHCEFIAIFGDKRGRRGAQLDVMSAVETAVYGYYTDRSRNEGEAYDDYYCDQDLGTSMLTLSNSDIAFAIGKKGLTRQKLQRASEAILQFVGNTLFVSGARSQRKRAKDYIKWLFAQLEGPISISTQGRDDVTAFDVPEDMAQYLEGEKRKHFIRLEDDWGVIMFFLAGVVEDMHGRTCHLLIFGPVRSRIQVELQLLHQLESRKPGFLTRGVNDRNSSETGFDSERLALHLDVVGHMLGSDKLTMKRIRNASGAICELLAGMLWIAGTGPERKRCREYVEWYLQMATKQHVEVDARGRDDITEIDVPPQATMTIHGKYGCELRRISSETGTFCLWANDHTGLNRLCILGQDEGDEHSTKGRTKAEIIVTDMIEEMLKSESFSTGRTWRSSRPSSRYRIPSPPTPIRRRWR